MRRFIVEVPEEECAGAIGISVYGEEGRVDIKGGAVDETPDAVSAADRDRAWRSAMTAALGESPATEYVPLFPTRREFEELFDKVFRRAWKLRDQEWVDAMLAALGPLSGFNVPAEPLFTVFVDLFAELATRALASAFVGAMPLPSLSPPKRTAGILGETQESKLGYARWQGARDEYDRIEAAVNSTGGGRAVAPGDEPPKREVPKKALSWFKVGPGCEIMLDLPADAEITFDEDRIHIRVPAPVKDHGAGGEVTPCP